MQQSITVIKCSDSLPVIFKEAVMAADERAGEECRKQTDIHHDWVRFVGENSE